MYLDDVTIGGPVDDILHDLKVIDEAKVLWLSLNNNKSEIIVKMRLFDIPCLVLR